MDLKREEELLLYCLGRKSGESVTTELKQVSAADWDKVIRQSVRHGVAPLLYHRLKTSGPAIKVPPSALQKLKKFYLQNSARNMKLYHELSKALAVLQNEGIPVIVLKGAHLAEIVYEHDALRPMVDVDLLLKKEDLNRGQKKLLEAGCLKRSSPLPMDIHWNIDLSISSLNIKPENLWERAQTAVIGGIDILVLSPEDLLLHLCTHLSFHHLFQGTGLRVFYDIRETVRHYRNQIVWKQVRHQAREWGCSNAVYLTFMLARDLMGAQVPDAVLQDLKPADFDPQIRAWAMEQIFQEAAAAPSLSPYFWQFWNPGPTKEKIHLFRKLLLPSPEFISQKYPAPFGSGRNYFYYLVRLKDHLMVYTRATWRMVIHDEEMVTLVKRENRNIAMREWLSS